GPVFLATATLRIEKDEPHVLKFEQVIKEENPQQDYYQTQYKVLQSRALASRVIGVLGLDQHPEFEQADQSDGWLATIQSSIREWLVPGRPGPPPPPPPPTADL